MVKKLDTSAPNLQRRDLPLGAGAVTIISEWWNKEFKG